jgi:uncharacterized protein (TIGR03437 family)
MGDSRVVANVARREFSRYKGVNGMSRPVLFLLAISSFSPVPAAGVPPGAIIRSRVSIPAALRSGVFSTDRYLNIPPGFQISLFAIVPGARFMAVAPNGDVLVSQPGIGQVTLLRPVPNGGVPQSFTFVSGLRRPHDIVFHMTNGTQYVYIAETNQINRFRYATGDTTAHDREVVVTGLPDSLSPEFHGAYAHELKNITFGGDDHLYVSIGSSCNVCTPDTTGNPVRGAIYQYNADGTGGRLFAAGLRNAEGVRFLPGTNTLWAVVNNRDQLPYPLQDSSGNYGQLFWSYVDNHPPDLFTAVRDGGNYGWPFCNSNPDQGFDHMPFDPDYDTNRDGHVDCGKLDAPTKGIQAHSAPLSLLFLQDTLFAQPYRAGAVTALHGSWDRSKKTGYKVAWFPWDAVTQLPEAQIDLVTGWLDDPSQSVWGKPVGTVVDARGSLLISDDAVGAIYRMTYAPAAVSAASGIALLAPESIGSVFGAGLSNQTAGAGSASWPDSLAGVRLSVQDNTGTARLAPLAYVSPAQINFEIPSGTATGNASLTLERSSGNLSLGTVPITAVAPALFSASGDGKGVAAATAVRSILPTNLQSPVRVFVCDKPGNCTSVPIQLGVDTPVYVSFYGTGIRGRASPADASVTIGGFTARILYAGAQGTYPGLDQVNVGLPLSLRGAGEVDVTLTVGGQSSNTVRIAIE